MKKITIIVGVVSMMSSCGIQFGNYDRWKEVHGKNHCLNEIQRSIDEIEYYIEEDIQNGNMKEDISVFYTREITNIQTYLQKLRNESKVWQANDGSLHTGQVEDYYNEREYDFTSANDCENCDEID
jgi:hypothetical protein